MQAVDDVSLRSTAGEILAMVGESGSGKSVTAMTLMGLTRGAQRAHRGLRCASTATELLDASDDAACAGSAARRSRWSSRTR